MMESREMEQKPMMIGPSRLSNGRVGTSSQIGGMMRGINESSVERNKHGHESIPCPHTLSPLSLYCLGLFTRYIVTLEWAKWATDAERDLFGEEGSGSHCAACTVPSAKLGMTTTHPTIFVYKKQQAVKHKHRGYGSKVGMYPVMVEQNIIVHDDNLVVMRAALLLDRLEPGLGMEEKRIFVSCRYYVAILIEAGGFGPSAFT